MDKYYIWLLLALGEGEPKINELLDRFGTPEAVYEAVMNNTALLGAELSAKAEKTSLKTAEKTLNAVLSKGYRIITQQSPFYPEHLKHIENPPCVLFASGDVSLLEKKLITVVGSRAVTDTTRAAIPKIMETMPAEYAVVGTLSEGCDQLTYLNAMKAGMPFIEVLPCGLSQTYPAGSRSMRRFLTDNGGLLITEYLPSVRSSQGNFLRRSRILGGISYVTLVLQAGSQSGALATAEHSSAPLFLPPYDVFRSEYSGAVNAVRNGAKLYMGSADIEHAYEKAVLKEQDELKSTDGKNAHEKAHFRKTPKRSASEEKPASEIEKEVPSETKSASEPLNESDFDTPEQFALYTAIRGNGGSANMEELLAKTGQPVEQLTELLLDMEIGGTVTLTAGRYTI